MNTAEVITLIITAGVVTVIVLAGAFGRRPR